MQLTNFKEQEFLVAFLKYFDFSPSAGLNQSRASLVVFGNDAYPQFDLTKYQKDPNANADIANAIMGIPYVPENTDIYE